MPKKIVCDTNTLLSGFLWRGKEFRLLSKIVEGRVVLFISPPLFQEFVRVLSYERIRPFVADAKAVVEKLKEMAVFVNPRDEVNAVKEDPADNKVLECALAAGADFVVSGDDHLLKLRSFKGIPLLTTKTALEKLA